MGAWGTGPLDNDTALDFIEDWNAEDSPLPFSVEELTRRFEGIDLGCYDEVRAVAALVTDVYEPDQVAFLVPLLTLRLEAILADSEWLECWVDEDEIKASVEAQLAALAAL